MLKQGQRIHDLRDSFNVIIKGVIRDEADEKDFDEFNVIADWPIQINVFDTTKTLMKQKEEKLTQTSSNRQQIDKMQGNKTKDALLLVAMTDCYMIRVTKLDGDKIQHFTSIRKLLENFNTSFDRQFWFDPVATNTYSA